MASATSPTSVGTGLRKFKGADMSKEDKSAFLQALKAEVRQKKDAEKHQVSTVEVEDEVTKQRMVFEIDRTIIDNGKRQIMGGHVVRVDALPATATTASAHATPANGAAVIIKFEQPGIEQKVGMAQSANEASVLRLLHDVVSANIAHVITYGPVLNPAGGKPKTALVLTDSHSLGDLHSIILRAGPLSEAETARVGADVISALKLLHARRIVHRDVDPANIILSSHPDSQSDGDGYVLIDFGVATQVSETEFRGNREAAKYGFGTFNYMSLSCEIPMNAAPHDDWESLAYTLLMLRDGKVPWDRQPDRNLRIGAKESFLRASAAAHPAAATDPIAPSSPKPFDFPPTTVPSSLISSSIVGKFAAFVFQHRASTTDNASLDHDLWRSKFMEHYKTHLAIEKLNEHKDQLKPLDSSLPATASSASSPKAASPSGSNAAAKFAELRKQALKGKDTAGDAPPPPPDDAPPPPPGDEPAPPPPEESDEPPPPPPS